MVSQRFWIGTLVAVWLLVNGLDAVWVWGYIRAATHPDPQTAVNKTRSGWKGYYVMSKSRLVPRILIAVLAHIPNVYIFGFFWGCMNIFAWFLLSSKAFGWFSKTHTGSHKWGGIGDSNAILMSWYPIFALVIFPLAVIMSLGPFFAPLIALKITQNLAWTEGCDSFAVEIVLKGVPYDAPPDTQPTATFAFWQNGSRVEFYEYSLVQNATNGDLWHFSLSQVLPNVTIPDNIYPLIRDISLQFSDNTLSANCAANRDAPPNATTPCVVGSFEDQTYQTYLSVTTDDTRTNTTQTLRSINKIWYAPQADDAPNFILKDVNADGSLGDVAAQTVVTDKRDCTALKVCASRPPGADILSPLGLALMRQSAYSKVCTAANSN